MVISNSVEEGKNTLYIKNSYVNIKNMVPILKSVEVGEGGTNITKKM